ncbi:MAG TPA: serine/threonine protein kinase [Xanthobacteraceae bacterium]|nr:serine/threonine protein kinase [Xanthobacteraceae bacterium]
MTGDAVAGRWQTAVVLKRDVFSTVERGTFRSNGGDVAAVLRRLDEVPWWSRPLAHHLFNRERRALAAATPLGIAPPLIYADDHRLVRGYIPGSALKISRPYGDHAYFRSARTALHALHRAGISHNDLAKEQNWLRSPDGRAYLLDFQLASVFERRSWLFRMAAYEDLRHFLKHKRRYVPDALTPAERRVLARKSLPTRIWMMTGKKIYMLITRGLLGFIDSEGGGARLAYDAPAIEAALKTFPGVRDAAVLDFPDRKSGTGLYAFVESDAPLRENDVRKQLALAVGPEKLPEFIQITDALPRRTDGEARRDILRLISTNQVDLIEPLFASKEEGWITDRLVASRKNLYGAPAITAALMAHPDVRDAAVLAYPDRLTGTGLYAFVEAREGTGARDLSEQQLAPYVAKAVGQENAPKFIQVVPALPRNAAGHVRTDILQLVATNQVDSIDALITSEAERTTVEHILNARHNMRDRFVL